MKKKIILVLLFGSLFYSCQQEQSYRQSVFFNDTQSGVVKYIVGTDVSLDLGIIATDVVNKDVTVSIGVDTSLIKTYKTKYGANVVQFPMGSYTISSRQVTIKGGAYKSENIHVSVDPKAEFREDVTYCLPITIIAINNSDIKVVQAYKTVYIMREPRRAINLAGNYLRVGTFSYKDSSIQRIPQVTLECRLQVKDGKLPWIGFDNNNIRLRPKNGDDNQFTGGLSVMTNEFVENKGLGGSSYILNIPKLALGTWYHVALVYDGAYFSLYINGNLAGNQGADRGTVDLRELNKFSIGGDGGLGISEVRLWTRALTPVEIQAGMCSSVDPHSKDLLCYWKMNLLSSGNVIKDATGHGYDMKAETANVNFVNFGSCP